MRVERQCAVCENWYSVLERPQLKDKTGVRGERVCSAACLTALLARRAAAGAGVAAPDRSPSSRAAIKRRLHGFVLSRRRMGTALNNVGKVALREDFRSSFSIASGKPGSKPVVRSSYPWRAQKLLSDVVLYGHDAARVLRRPQGLDAVVLASKIANDFGKESLAHAADVVRAAVAAARAASMPGSSLACFSAIAFS